MNKDIKNNSFKFISIFFVSKKVKKPFFINTYLIKKSASFNVFYMSRENLFIQCDIYTPISIGMLFRSLKVESSLICWFTDESYYFKQYGFNSIKSFYSTVVNLISIRICSVIRKVTSDVKMYQWSIIYQNYSFFVLYFHYIDRTVVTHRMIKRISKLINFVGIMKKGFWFYNIMNKHRRYIYALKILCWFNEKKQKYCSKGQSKKSSNCL